MKYEFIEHTADVEFRAYGKTLMEVFTNAAIATTKSIYEKEIKEDRGIKIEVEGRDLESLLYNFLEELIILFDSEGFLVSNVKKMKIDEEEKTLSCVLIGDSEGSYEIFSHIKAITYNEMFVRKENGVWICQVTLDV